MKQSESGKARREERHVETTTEMQEMTHQSKLGHVEHVDGAAGCWLVVPAMQSASTANDEPGGRLEVLTESIGWLRWSKEQKMWMLGCECWNGIEAELRTDEKRREYKSKEKKKLIPGLQASGDCLLGVSQACALRAWKERGVHLLAFLLQVQQPQACESQAQDNGLLSEEATHQRYAF